MRSTPLLAVAAATLALSAVFLAGVADAGATVTTFDFHRVTNTSSVLTIFRQDTLDGRVLNQQSYRAGSGLNTNECDSAAYDGVGGWLPAGYYSPLGHWDGYPGSKIQGRVWQLQDKRCSGGTGTLRTELFIHSEETSSQGQYCPTSGDDPFCWESDSDYYSLGCIKISRAAPYPSDLAKLDGNWHNWSGLTGSFSLPQRVYVY